MSLWKRTPSSVRTVSTFFPSIDLRTRSTCLLTYAHTLEHAWGQKTQELVRQRKHFNNNTDTNKASNFTLTRCTKYLAHNSELLTPCLTVVYCIMTLFSSSGLKSVFFCSVARMCFIWPIMQFNVLKQETNTKTRISCNYYYYYHHPLDLVHVTLQYLKGTKEHMQSLLIGQKFGSDTTTL